MPPGKTSVRLFLWLAVALASVWSVGTSPSRAAATAVPAPGPADHWAFQPPGPIALPPVKHARWVQSPVDRFILADMERAGLEPTRSASREQLIRRVTFDLIGLPPTPDEIDAFVADRRPDAWARLVDRLLDCPRYGERWARHWLDVVRYAESDGFEHDAIRPNTWRYRDYVVDAFNRDKPYDRFVQEQVAGDELWPEEPAAQIATAFNLLGPDMVDSSDQTQRRLLTLSDMTDITATAFLGLTLSCARCHDHKLEPFTQADYYGLQAHFSAAQFLRDKPVPTAEEHRRHEVALAEYNARTQALRAELASVEMPARSRLRDEKLRRMSEDVQAAHRTAAERRTPEQIASVLETNPQLEISETELNRALAVDARRRRQDLLAALKKIPAPAPLAATMALENTNGTIAATHVLARGDYNNPGPAVVASTPAVLRRLPSPDTITADAAPPRRAPLARWLTSPGNPLTARVMVNRLWQHHFGRGLVATPNDFGTQGARPTHPELLDWLAQEFIARGWSVKAMQRLIVLSATYQQSSTAPADTLAADPANRWLARQNRVRLEAEALRDSLLFVSGRLDLRMGGPSVQPPIADDIVRTSRNWTASADEADHHRRSVYIFARRNLRYPFLEVFDAPDSNLSCPQRGQSTTAPQSLTLLNSDEVLFAARETARRLAGAGPGDDTRIDHAFRLILGRHATRAERGATHDFLRETRARAGGSTADTAWIELCRALFNLNDFVYVE